MSFAQNVQQNLRAAWFGALTADAIADAFHISRSALQRFWRDERSGGRLPSGARPHFSDMTSQFPEDEHHEADGVEAEIYPGSRIGNDDPLLAALRMRHAFDYRRGARDLMDKNITGLERGDDLHSFHPTPLDVRAYQRARDGNVGARASIGAF